MDDPSTADALAVAEWLGVQGGPDEESWLRSQWRSRNGVEREPSSVELEGARSWIREQVELLHGPDPELCRGQLELMGYM